MYAIGKAVPKDDVQAYAWFNLAAAQGDEVAEQKQTFIWRRMTPAHDPSVDELRRDLANARRHL